MVVAFASAARAERNCVEFVAVVESTSAATSETFPSAEKIRRNKNFPCSVSSTPLKLFLFSAVAKRSAATEFRSLPR